MIEGLLISSSQGYIDMPELIYPFIFFSILVIGLLLKILRDLLDDFNTKSVFGKILHKSRIILILLILLFPISIFAVLSVGSFIFLIGLTIYVSVISFYSNIKNIIFRK